VTSSAEPGVSFGEAGVRKPRTGNSSSAQPFRQSSWSRIPGGCFASRPSSWKASTPSRPSGPR